MPESTYRFGDVEVEVGGRQVRRGGTRVALEPKALDVLLLLLATPGRVVEKRRLLAEVWADVHVTDSSLARAVTQVRRAIGDDIRETRYIETVPTRGYRFIGDLQPQVEAAPVGLSSRRSVDEGRGSAAPPRWWATRAGAVAVVLALAVSAIHLASRGQVSQAASADLGALLLSAIAHDAVQVTTSRGLDADPALSPDGTAIAYASDASGALEIHLRLRLAGATARAVTNNGGDNVNPAWSPDGQWLAYHSRRFGGVWVVHSGGGPARQLVTDGAAPSWSPDGRTLVFQTAGEADILGGTGGSPSTLHLVDVATGQVEALTRTGDVPGSHGSPVWLPGHDSVIFVAARVPAADVWQITRGGRTTRLGSCHASCRPFAFRRAGVTWVGALRRGKAQELWLAPVGPEGDVDMRQARMTPLPRTIAVTDVTVSADGAQMAFANTERTSEAWTIVMPGGDVSQATPPAVLLGERRPRYGEFAMSPDGTQLAYTTSRVGERPELWLHDLETSTSRQLSTTLWGFVKGWSPDGQALAVLSEDGPPAIKRLDVVTGRVTPLLDLAHWARESDVPRRLFTMRHSRNFQRFFYTTEERGKSSVWMADAGSVTTPMRVAQDAGFGAWSADGRQIAVQQFRGWRTGVGVIDAGGQEIRSTGPQEIRSAAAQEHRDARPQADTSSGAQQRGRTGAQETAGEVRLLVSDADLAWPNDWSPDDRHIVYAALRQGRWALEIVDVGTGRVRRLTARGAPGEYVRWPVWSPRGDRIVYERGYWKGNVWAATLPGT